MERESKLTGRTKLRFGIAALAAAIITGMASPERELVFFLLAGVAAGYLSPMARGWVPSLWHRLAGGLAVGFLACYARVAPWMGAEAAMVLQDAWLVTALATVIKAAVIFAAMDGIYARLRQDGWLGA
jgi:hypothetical protein